MTAKAKRAKPELIPVWIQGVLEANAILQRHIETSGADVPLPVLKALADVDWACRALAVADAAWTKP